MYLLESFWVGWSFFFVQIIRWTEKKKNRRSSDCNCGNLFCFVVFFLLKRHGKVKDGLQEFLVVKSELWNWQIWGSRPISPLLAHWMILSKCLNHMDAQFKSEDNLSERDVSKTERVRHVSVGAGPSSQPVLNTTLSVTLWESLLIEAPEVNRDWILLMSLALLYSSTTSYMFFQMESFHLL